MTTLEIELVPCLMDNYAYLVFDGAAGVRHCRLRRSRTGVERGRARGVNLTSVLPTHHHPDHVGGNQAAQRRSACRSSAPTRFLGIPGVDSATEGGSFSLGGHVIFWIPAHTSGTSRSTSSRPRRLHRRHAVRRRLRPAVRGHARHDVVALQAYAPSRQHAGLFRPRIHGGKPPLRATLEPDNADLQTRMEDVREMRARGSTERIPSNMGIEKKTNPFLRAQSRGDPSHAGSRRRRRMSTMFAETRRRKDKF